jgi:hypothetical protein
MSQRISHMVKRVRIAPLSSELPKRDRLLELRRLTLINRKDRNISSEARG